MNNIKPPSVSPCTRLLIILIVFLLRLLSELQILQHFFVHICIHKFKKYRRQISGEIGGSLNSDQKSKMRQVWLNMNSLSLHQLFHARNMLISCNKKLRPAGCHAAFSFETGYLKPSTNELRACQPSMGEFIGMMWCSAFWFLEFYYSKVTFRRGQPY